MSPSVTVGQQFHSLLVVSRNGSNPSGRAVWVCKCACGQLVSATSKQLTVGYLRACPNCQDSGSKSALQVRLRKYEVAPSGCWNWTGKQNDDGYGCIRVNGVYTRAHRAMFYTVHPDADQSLVVMHKCDNPRCINPEHLMLGTQQDNMRDMVSKGRHNGGAPKGNKNALGNKGWMVGGITAKYVASKLGDTVEVPDELIQGAN